MPMSFLALLLAAAPVQPGLATPARPALLRPVVEPAARCSADPRLVVAVTRFAPPSGGTASLVVSLRTSDGRTRELGHVAIFPHQAFSAGLSGAQRFGFAVPRAALRQDPRVMVEVRTDPKGAAGARAVIGEARISAAPKDRGC